MNEDAPSPVVRNAAGQFVPGGGSGKPKGTLQRITKLMKQQLSDALEDGGEEGNPLIILLSIARDQQENGAVRVQAADRLLRYVAPQLMSVELQHSDDATFEAETTRIKATLRGLLIANEE